MLAWLLRLSAIFVFAIAFLLHRNFRPQPPLEAQVVYTPSPVYIPSTPEPTPEPTIEPIPEPTPEPTPNWTFSIRQTGNQEWIVRIPKGDWYDTGIPITTNYEVMMRGSARDRWIVRVNGNVSFSRDRGCWGGKFEEQETSYQSHLEFGCQALSFTSTPDYSTTFSIKIPDDSPQDMIQLKITLWGEKWQACPSQRRDVFSGQYIVDDTHRRLHEIARQNVNRLRQKVAIY